MKEVKCCDCGVGLGFKRHDKHLLHGCLKCDGFILKEQKI